jgi:hypothetical protein
MTVMRMLGSACAVAAGLALAACGGGTPSPPPASTPATSTAGSAFPVYTQDSSSYNALLACLFDAGYKNSPAANQAAETITFSGGGLPAITFKVNPDATPKTIAPADARTEVILHTAGCPGAF